MIIMMRPVDENTEVHTQATEQNFNFYKETERIESNYDSLSGYFRILDAVIYTIPWRNWMGNRSNPIVGKAETGPLITLMDFIGHKKFHTRCSQSSFRLCPCRLKTFVNITICINKIQYKVAWKKIFIPILQHWGMSCSKQYCCWMTSHQCNDIACWQVPVVFLGNILEVMWWNVVQIPKKNSRGLRDNEIWIVWLAGLESQVSSSLEVLRVYF